ncbi:MAG TPA: DUF4062 domain-containing protein [Mucilaginibacter sp.]
MAKPRVFVSSTFYDLKHIRSSIENFIDGLGYESVLSEKGDIAYNPDIPLDESCYKEVHSCDIFVLIIGGRYGSSASSEGKIETKDFYTRFESITKLEYENANNRDIPTYILIEKSVYAEYETFKRNRDNKTIIYASVDSVNIFVFIDKILSQTRNNPIQQFERHIDIESWLKLQWAGLFKDLIQKRKTQAEINELSKEVKELSNINTTLKRYLEEIVSTTDGKKGHELIEQEEERLAHSRTMNEFKSNPFVVGIVYDFGITIDEAFKLFSNSKTLEEFAVKHAEFGGYKGDRESLLKAWKYNNKLIDSINAVRRIINKPPFKTL